MFGDEGDQGTEPVVDETPVEGYSSEPQDDAPASETQSNPFWKDVEDRVGPNVFTTIKPFLDKADAEAQRGIASANERLRAFQPFQSFIDEGISPEYLRQAVGYANQLNEAPEVIFEHLQTFLEQNGRLPSKAELKKEVEEGTDPVEEDPRDIQLKQLQEQQSQMQQFLQSQIIQQQQEQLTREADDWADQQIRDITEKHPELSKEDLGEVLRIASYQAQQTGGAIDLTKAIKQYTDLTNRIRTAPRAGAAAPRVPGGVGGGTPGEVPKNPGSMTPAERQALVASRFGNNQ